MSELNIKVRKSQDNGSTFRATPDTLYMGGVGSAKVDTLHFEVPEEWAGCAITLHVQRLSGALPDPQMLDENNCVVVDRRWTQEKQGSWMLLAVDENGYIAMTKPGQYTCYETIDTNSTTETITPSVYEQFVALVKKWGQAAVDAARAAKESEERAAGSASASAGSAAAAARSESAAAGSATAASGSASAAEQAKAAAATSEANAKDSEDAAKAAAEEAAASKAAAATSEKKPTPARPQRHSRRPTPRRTKRPLPRRSATPRAAPPPLPAPLSQPPGARTPRREVQQQRPGVRPKRRAALVLLSKTPTGQRKLPIMQPTRPRTR